MQRTEISDLGRFALIDRLLQGEVRAQDAKANSCAHTASLVELPQGVQTLSASKLILEGIHFDLVYTPLKHLGYKAVVASLADIYAQGGAPRGLRLNLGVSSRFSVEDLDTLASGVHLACRKYGVELVGLDVTASLTGLSIATSVLGQVYAADRISPTGAQVNDLICCTGNLGAAYMGLQLLEREKRVFADESTLFTPELEGYEYILERQLKPELALDVLAGLREKGVRPSSMIEVTDGLASELLHIAKHSGVGVRIYEERIPIDYETARMAETLQLNATTVALSGGEDYEFLFTVPLGMMDVVKDIDGLRFIGHITAPDLGTRLILPTGEEVDLKAQGWK